MIQSLVALGVTPTGASGLIARASPSKVFPPKTRVRPSDSAWPSELDWSSLGKKLKGELIRVESPLTESLREPLGESCKQLFAEDLNNPYLIGDSPALTQTLGWLDAWISQASVYAVAAENAQDVAEAINFARQRRLRLVVKGGGHSYHGTSSGPDSLLIWTKRLQEIKLHDQFVGENCKGAIAAQPAISLGAGTIWMQAYAAATTQAKRYVQGGGCTTVGVGGLVQSGGFGSFSKAFGTAAAGLLEAEVVTSDGVIRIANPHSNPDLFWALRGGGGGNFGVVTRVTLRTHDLPEFFGAVVASIEAKSDKAYLRLIKGAIELYQTSLFNAHWGEQLIFGTGNKFAVRMVFQGLTQQDAEATWKPFFNWVAMDPEDFKMAKPTVLAIPAEHFWNPEVLKRYPGLIQFDKRTGAQSDNMFWSGDAGQVGQYLHGYHSVWLGAELISPGKQESLANALFKASRSWQIALHCNKGLAGGNEDAISATRSTAMNPAVTKAFALAICAAGESPAYPGIAGHEPNIKEGRLDSVALHSAIAALKEVAPDGGSYLSESDYFLEPWQRAYWGQNYERLLRIKRQYDAAELFTVHHGVGSEAWSKDGFSKAR